MISKTRNKLTGVHQTFGINRGFDRAHQCNRIRPVFGFHEIKLAIANAMFASTGPAQFKGAFDHAVMKALCLGHLIRIIGIKQDQGMEITIPDMPDNRAGQRAGITIGTGLGNRFGQF